MRTFSAKAKATVKTMLMTNMPASPSKWSVRRPARSMSGIETSVMTTMMPPTDVVAYVASSSSRPTAMNRLVE